MYARYFRSLLWGAGAVVFLLALLMISGEPASVQGQGVPTPSAEPVAPLLAVPQVQPDDNPISPAGPDPAALAALAEIVHAADMESSASTLWAGDPLGVDSAPHLALAVGDKLPAFGLMTQAGEPFELDLHGRPLLVNLWASWCPPCIAEFPLLIEADRAALPYDVVFVNIWDDPAAFAAFLEAYPAEIRVMIDAMNRLPDLYHLEFVPVSILVDAEGIIRLIQLGPVNEPVIDFATALLE